MCRPQRRNNLSALSVGQAVDNPVHKPRRHWPAGRCPKIAQSGRLVPQAIYPVQIRQWRK